MLTHGATQSSRGLREATVAMTGLIDPSCLELGDPLPQSPSRGQASSSVSLLYLLRVLCVPQQRSRKDPMQGWCDALETSGAHSPLCPI